MFTPTADFTDRRGEPARFARYSIGVWNLAFGVSACRLAGVLGLALGLAGSRVAFAGETWISLFDGKTLNGWKQLGGKAKYEVREGAIVGIIVPEKQNSFLVTTQEFGDFIFECEFKPDAGLNSGIMFRGLSRQDYRDGRVYGYQYEIDPTPRGLTGGFYDESRKGWFSPSANNGPPRDEWVKARGDGKWLKVGEWNRARIECRGSKVKLWLNGKVTVEYDEPTTARGFIGLQVHTPGGRAELIGKEVAFRNLRIRKLD